MVRFSRGWWAVLRMGHPQGRWSMLLVTHNGVMPSQFQGIAKVSALYHEIRWNVGFRGKTIIRSQEVHDPMFAPVTLPRGELCARIAPGRGRRRAGLAAL